MKLLWSKEEARISLVDSMSMAKSNLEVRGRALAKLRKQELANCFQCMKCTSGCTALKLLELKPHEIVKLTNLGLVDELISSEIIWTCVTCLKCVQRCPQRASPYQIILVLRNLAVEKEAKIPEEMMKAISTIIETGLAEGFQDVVTLKMQSFNRDILKLPRLCSPKESFQATFMKALEGR